MSVEFLSGEDPGDAPEEQLDATERWRWRGWLVIAVLLVGAVVWALIHPSRVPSHRHAGPAPTASKLADPRCRGLAGCSVRAGVPPAIARLARAYLPPGVQLRVRTVVADSSLIPQHLVVARDIDAQIDSVTVLIRVQRAGSGNEEIAPDPLGVGSLLVHQLNSGLLVRLQYLAPDTVPPDLARLRALIRDPALTSR